MKPHPHLNDVSKVWVWLQILKFQLEAERALRSSSSFLVVLPFAVFLVLPFAISSSLGRDLAASAATAPVSLKSGVLLIEID